MLSPPVLAIFTGAALLLGGCASGYEMKVDAISRPPKVVEQAVSYEIHSKSPENPEDSLRYKEAAKFVKTALSSRGMYEATPPQQPDMIVEIDYGIGPPKPKLETRSEPIYVQVPGPVTYQSMPVGVAKNGTPIIQVVPVQGPPQQQYVGDREYQVLVVNYEKYLHMTARENVVSNEGHPPPEIWTIDVTSEGESKDLRKYLPALAAATIDYVGKDTRGMKDVELKDEKAETNGAVAFVKKGM